MKKYAMAVALCLSLGLAPFVPEPHIVGKIRWIIGGAAGMSWMDWWDTIWHGAPWMALVYIAARDLWRRLS